jgi:formiminotetrahydrofolate cyclodeaminase
MIGFRLFQFGWFRRNQENDQRRIAFVQKAVLSAVADAEAEARRLRAAISKTTTSVTTLLAQIEDGDPKPTCRAELTNLEQRLRVGQRRLAQLNDHLAVLQRLENAATRQAP